MQRAVRDAMWEFCGVVRDADGLERGLAELDAIAGSLENTDVSPNEEGWADLGHLFDLSAALLTARATLLGARAREESRGAHRRADFSVLDRDLRLGIEIRRDAADGASLVKVRIPDVPERLRPALDAPAPEVSGARMLE
jgi:succinate dehydrogenase/fumarate reductase flavoprotein subunit